VLCLERFALSCIAAQWSDTRAVLNQMNPRYTLSAFGQAREELGGHAN
jgi:hypothetical protein